MASKPSKKRKRNRQSTSRAKGANAARPVPAAAATIHHKRPSLQPALAATALVAMALVCYLPAMLWGGFVWDDIQGILEEQALLDWAGLWNIWFAPSALYEPHYRPLIYTTFWLEHKLWGFTPNGYHVVNVLLHAANAVLLWRILLALAVPGAWAIAAVFAVHPLHVESVAWVIERKDVLSGLCYLGCVMMWLRYLHGVAAGPNMARIQRIRYAAALALLAAGMLAKNIVVTLPAALLILQWWHNGRITILDGLRVAPFFAVALGIVAVDLHFVTTATPATFDLSFIERMLIAARALWFYVGQLAWPSDLAVIYPRWEIDSSAAAAWLPLLGALALVASLWFFRDRIGRGPLAGALFYAVTLSPALGFIDHTYMLFSFVADRYQYLAGIGALAVVIGMATVAVQRLPSPWRSGAAVAGAALLALLGTLTWRQADIYRDEVTFFQHIVTINPEAVGAHLNLAEALIAENRLEEAAAAGRIAVAQRPDSHDAHINLAVALAELNQLDDGERHLRRAVDLAPEEESAPLENLGVLLSRRNKLDEAETLLRRAWEIDPDDLSILRNLAKLLQGRSQAKEALALYDRLLELGGANVDTHTARGETLLALERHDEALAAWRQALSLASQPSAAFSLHIAMGRAEWAKRGDPNAAAAHYERALAIIPNDAGALGDLAALRIAAERYEDAVALFARAIEQQPDNARWHAGRGYAQFRLGEAGAAVRSLERALALDPTLAEARSHLALARQSRATAPSIIGTGGGNNGSDAQG